MGKDRKSKRQLIRDEKRAKKRGLALENEEERQADRKAKRQRTDDFGNDYIPLIDERDASAAPGLDASDGSEREFFGLLSDEEQEYFRHADEMLELNDFASPEERNLFLQNVYKEAEGKELKLACSQSCSRLMERLILLSNTKQKKHLFEAFAGHFYTLTTHRFASHCCEKLFLQSAPGVTREMGDGSLEMKSLAEGAEADETPPVSMEELFLLTLDELELQLPSLMTDRFGSHAIRVLLMILSGRPLDRLSKSLLHSRKKENITVHGASAVAEDTGDQIRAVPSSFATAVRKIISDTTAATDAMALRVLAKHPTGNPVLQLLLELDMQHSRDIKHRGDTSVSGGQAVTLLGKMLPDAPSSLSDSSSEASEFVHAALYDPIASRLLETIITHGPAKVFKALYSTTFATRVPSLLRNEVASYPALRVLGRLSKEDLIDVTKKCLAEVPSYVERRRFNVLTTLFARCDARGATQELDQLVKAVATACGGDWKCLVPKLCLLEERADSAKQPMQQNSTDKSLTPSHGCQLLLTMLSVAGEAPAAVQQSLLSLTQDQLVRMAKHLYPTANVLVRAFSTPSRSSNFHKLLAGALAHNALELATSPIGQHVLNAVISTPCKGSDKSVPFHIKEIVISKLAEHEPELRESWAGRNIWRSWKGDWFVHRRADWTRWVKTMVAS